MRVALLSTFHERCGIATYSEALVPALTSQGVEVEVFAPRLAAGDLGWGEQPRRLWHRNRAFGFEALRLFREIRAARCDLVHAQVNLGLFSSRLLFNLGWLLERAGIPLVATLHGRAGGSLGRNFKLWRFARALRHATLIVHTAEHQRELGKTPSQLIAHGIAKHPTQSRAEARHAIGLDEDAMVLTHFGFLVPDKGVTETLHAVAELRRSLPKLEYWIAGAVASSAESRRYFDSLKSEIAALDLTDCVHLSGAFTSEARTIQELQAADWIVLNYRRGGSQGASGAVRTALGAGRPVAVSRAPIFDDVRSAVRTLEGPLAPALRRLLADPALTQEYEARAAALCEAQSWQQSAQQHATLYANLLGSRQPRGT